MTTQQTVATRTWYRLHLSTYVTLLLFCCGVILIEIPGQPTEQIGCFAPESTKYEHGWPWVYLERWTDLSRERSSVGLDVIPWLHPACWNISARCDPAPDTMYLPRYVALDVACGVVVICGAGAVAEWWRRRRHRIWQFTLTDLLAAALVCAAALGWWRHQHDRYQKALELLQAPINDSPQVIREPRSGALLRFGYTGPSWLARLIGTRPLGVFIEPIDAMLVEDDPGKAIRELSRHKSLLTHLRNVTLAGPLLTNGPSPANIDAESIRNLAQLASVESLSISGCRLDDHAVDQIAQMPGLRELSLFRCDGMTNAGAARLSANRRLERVSLLLTPPPAE